MADYRNRLINGLAQVFETENKPLNHVTIADICAASKVSKRTFYEYFNNKEDCFLALYEQNSFRILSKVIERGTSLNVADHSVLHIMDEVLNAYLEEILTRSNLMARIYIDILVIDQKGIELRYSILKSYAVGIKNMPFQVLEDLSVSEILLFLSGVNELVLYHLHNAEFISIFELKQSVQRIILKFIG